MDFFLLIIGLLFATILIVGIGERIKLPYPILMLIFATLAGFLPFMPEMHIDPELILPIFLPPLLFATAQRSSWSVFRFRWKALIRLAVVLIVVTAGTVAATALAFSPIVSIPLALALGAIVAPPDPVAVDAIATKVNMPRRLTSLLETEGLFNDAMAIVIFQLAVQATVNDSEVGLEIVPQFLIGAAGAVVLGLAMGWVIGALNRFVPNLAARCAATLVAPYAVYMLAEEVHVSGVIAVVVTALEMVRRDRPQDSAERLTRQAFWEVLELLATGLAFGLMGIEMNQVIQEEGSNLIGYIPGIAAICFVVIAVRALWMLATYYLPNRTKTKIPARKDALVLTWCGMRGLATLALALALPHATADGTVIEERNFVVVAACSVLLCTLVLPGLTLPSLMRVLKLRNNEQDTKRARRALARRAEAVAMSALRNNVDLQELPENYQQAVRRRMNSLHSILARDPDPHDAISDEKYTQIRAVIAKADSIQAIALEAARDELLKARREPNIDPHLVDEIVVRLDRRTATLDR
ncbi:MULTISPECIES: cation:proton antiporter [Glutamicibacter]|uniref:Sodium:proton antiporter n=1 Tax=Glutamicibacter halophytocola TaxID=1933880 RepID=A0AA94XT43_9MICC|nr:MULTISPECIES: sodium:proton antiporter [Glutamicibacter]ALG27873.1 sodium:proton antiporter [Glutamicibacter halophytocola]MBF6671992.1 sodium:proton antiporter [Glutamicibacter sp. FBE19]NQD41506.1 sodium:proton antiporter [Glutamicibacter halophytocola]UUX59385.1 sodium:proton antiporter [Glutamicibacter halophytocola]